MGASCLLSASGRSGCVVTKNGDIILVFSVPGAHEGKRAILAGIAYGGWKLDCFEGFLLQRFYPEFGFVDVKRIAWSDQYAPPGWSYELNKRPDIVWMELPKDLRGKK